MTDNPTPLPPPPALGSVPVDDDRPAFMGIALSLVLAGVAVIAAAALYGLIAYYTESVYFYLTVVCGVMVGAALGYGFPRRNWVLVGLVLLVPAVALALLGIALGEMLFYTLAVANEYNLTMTAAAGEVLGIAGDILTDSEVYLPYGLSALGAVLGLVGVLRRR